MTSFRDSLLPFVHELWLSHVLLQSDPMMYVFSLSDCVLGQVSVPFDLVKKQPKGQQTFALMTKDSVTGSLTTDVSPTAPLTSVKRYYYFFTLTHFQNNINHGWLDSSVYLPGTQWGEVLAPSDPSLQQEGGDGPDSHALWHGGHHHHCSEEQARPTAPTRTQHRYSSENQTLLIWSTHRHVYTLTQKCKLVKKLKCLWCAVHVLESPDKGILFCPYSPILQCALGYFLFCLFCFLHFYVKL